MSGAFPASPGPASVQLGGLQTSLVSRARSGKRQSRRKGANVWTVTATWPALRATEWAPLFAFAMAQGGQFGSFQWVVPGVPGSGAAPAGSWAGAPVVDGANQVGTTLNIRGLTPSATLIARAGDVFKPAGSSKVYMVTSDANADGSGKAALAIAGPLIVSPADGEALTHASVPFTFAFPEDQQQLMLTPPLTGALTLNFAESW